MNKFTLLITGLLIGCFGFATNNKASNKGLSVHVIEIKFGKTVMQISATGGRIISYSYNHKEILTQTTEHENFGSTLWTAPQSNWGWPPFDILDNQEYMVEKIGNKLKMKSKPDPNSGFQFEKTWQTENNNSIRIEYVIRNITGKPKSVGSWEVTRVPCGGFAFFPDGGRGKIPESNLKSDLEKDGFKWVSINKNPIPEHNKLFSTAKEGWLAYSVNGLLFIKKFPDIKPENYSPQQGEVEIYINKSKIYTELENQGAYQVLGPGETMKYIVTWYLVPIPKTVENKIGSHQLVDFTRNQINNK